MDMERSVRHFGDRRLFYSLWKWENRLDRLVWSVAELFGTRG